MPAQGGPAKLTGIGELLGRSWHLYRMRFQVFSLVYIFYLTPLMLISAFCFFVYKISPHPVNPFIMAWIIAGVIMGVLVSVWGQAAFVYAVSDPAAGVRSIIHRATESVRKFFWLYLLFFALTIAGFVFFVIPGLVMMVWFSFAVFILASRGDSGIDALLESREYVKGFWWPVFIRLLAVWALSFAFGYLPVIGSLLSLLFMPYLVTYTSQLYDELANIKGAMPKPTERQRKKWSFIATAGLIVTVCVMIYGATQVDFKQMLSESIKGVSIPQKGEAVRKSQQLRAVPPQNQTKTKTPLPGIPRSI